MNTLQRYALLFLAGVIAALASGCASTQIVSAWRDPALNTVPFKKMLVVFQHKDAALRRVMEAEMAHRIPGAVPAHNVFSDTEVQDMALVKARVRADGFDSAVVMRIVSVEREVSYRPGQVYAVPAFYNDFWGYWGYGWRSVYEPGYLRSDRVVTIATNVYSVADDKLVWASQSETFNPATLREAVSEVIKVTSRAAGEFQKSRD